MNQLKPKISTRKKIRKILLINSDNEMQKKIKAKKYVLINSMTPEELENSFQLYKSPVNLSLLTFTNVVETHIIQKIVDTPNNIEYYSSDLIGNKKEKMKKRFLFLQLYSTKNCIVNYDNILNDNKVDKKDKENEENHHKDELGEHIIPFSCKKKCVGEEKIMANKTYPLISFAQKNINIEEEKNVSCECNSNNKEECDICNERKKDKKKILDINHKLIYYCYTHLKRKRPLITKKSDNTTILGSEIEEEIFSKNNINQFNREIKKGSKHAKDIVKNINSVKIKTKDITNINTKGFIKKRNSIKIKNTYAHNIYENNQNNLALEKEKKMLKRFSIKLQSIRSETYSKREHRLSSQNIVKSKKIFNSNIKGYKSINENKRYRRNTATQNIISKADTKNSSFDNLSSENISSSNKNKKILNSIHLHKKKELNKHNEKSKNKNEKNEKNEKIITRNNFKYLTHHHRIKNESAEEMKTEKIKKHKKTNGPIRCKLINFLQKYTEFNKENDFKENNNKYIRNNHKSSINKMKSFKCKSKKACLNYEENLNDENRLSIARIKSNESVNKYIKKIKERKLII